MQNFPPNVPATTKTQVLGLENNIAALLCYLPVCGVSLIASILWLVTEPKTNRFVRFHAVQSLILFGVTSVVCISLFVVVLILTAVLGKLLGVLGGIVYLLGMLVIGAIGLAALILAIIGMIKSYGNQLWHMPLVGSLAEKYS
jgi:uncharacterized membrane protein